MQPSRLLEMMFEHDRWQALLDKSTEKGIPLKSIKELCSPEERIKLLKLIISDEYNVFPPHIQKIPKDKPGEFREVYINEDRDRIILALINDCLCEIFPHFIHPNCVSYKKGIGTQKVVGKISKEIVNISNSIQPKQIGWKADFSKYFDNVKIEAIDDVLDRFESELGFKQGTEPVINLLRRYYHQDLAFDSSGNFVQHYQGLKQGCAVASILANACLYELDEFMTNKYKIYYRYSDDVVVIDNNTTNVVNEMNSIITKYGVTLNPKKVEPLFDNKWFKFLGFSIKGELITLSRNRLKKFQKEVEKRSIKKRKCTAKQAKRNIIKYLYEGEYSWATSCLGIVNVKPDLDEMNNFIMDCIRACGTNKRKVGGLGFVNNLPDRTVVRGKGRHVKKNREKINAIDNYLSVGCMSNNLKICKSLFETTVRDMRN